MMRLAITRYLIWVFDGGYVIKISVILRCLSIVTGQRKQLIGASSMGGQEPQSPSQQSRRRSVHT